MTNSVFAYTNDSFFGSIGGEAFVMSTLPPSPSRPNYRLYQPTFLKDVSPKAATALGFSSTSPSEENTIPKGLSRKDEWELKDKAAKEERKARWELKKRKREELSPRTEAENNFTRTAQAEQIKLNEDKKQEEDTSSSSILEIKEIKNETKTVYFCDLTEDQSDEEDPLIFKKKLVPARDVTFTGYSDSLNVLEEPFVTIGGVAKRKRGINVDSVPMSVCVSSFPLDLNSTNQFLTE